MKDFAKDLNAFAEKHGCEIATDNYGQIIVYTCKMLDENGHPISFRFTQRLSDDE
jgi:hypothetical protein